MCLCSKDLFLTTAFAFMCDLSLVVNVGLFVVFDDFVCFLA